MTGETSKFPEKEKKKVNQEEKYISTCYMPPDSSHRRAMAQDCRLAFCASSVFSFAGLYELKL
jgi:hypothetical protein